LGDPGTFAAWQYSLREQLDNRDAETVIPAKTNRLIHIPHDEELYKWRHLIENYFSKIKEFRGINTSFDKTDVSYEASRNLAATTIALR
jgi:transposase